MKKILALLAIVVMAAGVAVAAPKTEKKVSTVVFTTDIDCGHCAQKVYNTIPYEKGIKDVVVDLKTKTVTVKLDPAKSSIEALQKAFASIKVKIEKSEVKE